MTSAMYCNPQWAKANQALEKLQSDKKVVAGSGDEKKETDGEKATTASTHDIASPPEQPNHPPPSPYGQYYQPYYDQYAMCGPYPRPSRPPASYYGLYGPGPGPGPYGFPPYRPPRNVPPPPPPYLQNRPPPPPQSPKEPSGPQSKDNNNAVNKDSSHESLDGSTGIGKMASEMTLDPFRSPDGPSNDHFQSNNFSGGYPPIGAPRMGFPGHSPRFQNGVRPPHGKQPPDAGGIRFQLPKRAMMPGNAIHNYQMSQQQQHKFSPQGPRQQVPVRFQSPAQQKLAQSQYRPPSPATTGSVSEPKQPSEETATPAKTPTAGAVIPAASDWPPALKAYVQRCFASATSNTEKDRMERLLKQKLTDVFESGNERATNWAVELLPGQMRVGGLGSTSSSSSSPMRGNGRGRGRGQRSSRWSVAVDSQSDSRRRTKRSPCYSKRSRSRSSSRSSTSSRSRSRSPYFHRRKRQSRSRYAFVLECE